MLQVQGRQYIFRRNSSGRMAKRRYTLEQLSLWDVGRFYILLRSKFFLSRSLLKTADTLFDPLQMQFETYKWSYRKLA